MFSVSKSTDAQTLFVEIVADPLFDTYLSDMYFFFNLWLQDLKSEPTVEFLTSGTKTDDNMEFSDSESEEPRRYKSDAAEKSIANLKVKFWWRKMWYT